jgi:hypothetical protein
MGHRLWQSLVHPGTGCAHVLPAAARQILRAQQPMRHDGFDEPKVI